VRSVHLLTSNELRRYQTKPDFWKRSLELPFTPAGPPRQPGRPTLPLARAALKFGYAPSAAEDAA
jgi:hypothetical protein